MDRYKLNSKNEQDQTVYEFAKFTDYWWASDANLTAVIWPQVGSRVLPFLF